MKNGGYHYLESGLDYVFLGNGFEVREDNEGTTVFIQNIEGLHKVIGHHLATDKKRLRGKEIRFLRTEMLMSQRVLASLLQVDEQTVARWEKGHIRMPASADATLRLLYLEHNGGNEKISKLLQTIADLEDEIDRRMTLEETEDGWNIAA